jgi:hypothetical protein
VHLPRGTFIYRKFRCISGAACFRKLHSACRGTSNRPVRQVPLAFERWEGTHGDRYVAHSQSFAVAIDDGRLSIHLRGTDDSGSTAISANLVGAKHSRPRSGPALAGKVNYIIGNDPKRWQIGLATYERVTYPEIYPGIDIVYYGNQQQLEFDFIVKAGADPSRIRIKFNGERAPLQDGDGSLRFTIAGSDLTIPQPHIYQMIEGARRTVTGRYRIEKDNEVTFDLGEYDRAAILVIDPVIVYSAVLGGSATSRGSAVAVDASGTYLTGNTFAPDFPIVNAAQPTTTANSSFGDAFISKINPAGTALIYSTFLGGGLDDAGLGIAVGPLGEAWVVGRTNSSNFPVVNPAQPSVSTAFVAKLDPTGALQFSTYLGGKFAWATGVRVDSLGDAYVCGRANPPFPTTPGAYQTTGDGFVAKYASGGSVTYATMIPGIVTALAVDASGIAYLTGNASGIFPNAPAGAVHSTGAAAGDAFIAKITPSGTGLLYNTFLGSAGPTTGTGIELDVNGNVYVAGYTSDANLPTSHGAAQTTFGGGFQDGFVAKLLADGSSFTFVTYLGGSRFESIDGLAVDASGNAYVT